MLIRTAYIAVALSCASSAHGNDGPTSNIRHTIGPITLQKQLDGSYCWSSTDSTLRGCGLCDVHHQDTATPQVACYPRDARLAQGKTSFLSSEKAYWVQSGTGYRPQRRVVTGFDGQSYTMEEFVPYRMQRQVPVTIYKLASPNTPVYVDRPIERKVYVNRPIYIDRPVPVVKPVPVPVDRPVYVERRVPVPVLPPSYPTASYYYSNPVYNLDAPVGFDPAKFGEQIRRHCGMSVDGTLEKISQQDAKNRGYNLCVDLYLPSVTYLRPS